MRRRSKTYACIHVLLVLSGVGSVLDGCSGDTTGPAPVRSYAQIYWALVLNQHAINMSLTAPSNTIQLTATALNANGTPLPGAGAVTFSATDSNVTVSPTGLVTAHYVTGGTHVIASLQVGGVVNVDTALIEVTATAPTAPLSTFSIQPAAGDSAIRALLSGGYAITVRATDANGQAVPFGGTNYVHFESLNPVIATVDPYGGFAQPHDTGHVIFVATTWYYGVAKQDSLHFLVGWPIGSLNGIIGISNTEEFSHPVIFLGVGGKMLFVDYGPIQDEVVFDDSAEVDSAEAFSGSGFTGRGNISIEPSTIFTFLARSFPVAGTYHYHSKRYPSVTGVIYVHPQLH